MMEERVRSERDGAGSEPEGAGRKSERPTASATLPIAASIVPGTPGAPREAAAGRERLLPADRHDELRRAWVEIQSSFIDEPQQAVRKADGVVQELMSSLSERFDSARRGLEGEWQGGAGPDTESLRQAFQRYRTLFDRLLSF